MCGADGCRMVERHLEHDSWPLLATLSTWPSHAGPAPPGPFYRLTIVPLDERGRPNLSAQSEPIFLVPKQHLARNSDGTGGVFWSASRGSPSRSRRRRALYGRFPRRA